MQYKNNKRLLANGEVCLITQPEIAMTLEGLRQFFTTITLLAHNR